MSEQELPIELGKRYWVRWAYEATIAKAIAVSGDGKSIVLEHERKWLRGDHLVRDKSEVIAAVDDSINPPPHSLLGNVFGMFARWWR